MAHIIVRTVIIYIILLIVMRIMGKRQLGELELSELITTLLFSEIATYPITNKESRLIEAIVPIFLIAALEIILSLILIKVPILKKILTASPSMIIQKGKINKKEMLRSRLSLDELISQIRQNGVFDINEVDYAILEENGKMTVVPKAIHRTPTMRNMGLAVSDTGLMHIIISDGKINYQNLNLVKQDKKWLESTLQRQGLKPQNIFCMTADDSLNLFIQTKNGKVISISTE